MTNKNKTLLIKFEEPVHFKTVSFKIYIQGLVSTGTVTYCIEFVYKGDSLFPLHWSFKPSI